jgi:hypothetical protein
MSILSLPREIIIHILSYTGEVPVISYSEGINTNQLSDVRTMHNTCKKLIWLRDMHYTLYLEYYKYGFIYAYLFTTNLFGILNGPFCGLGIVSYSKENVTLIDYIDGRKHHFLGEFKYYNEGKETVAVGIVVTTDSDIKILCNNQAYQFDQEEFSNLIEQIYDQTDVPYLQKCLMKKCNRVEKYFYVDPLLTCGKKLIIAEKLPPNNYKLDTSLLLKK